MTTGTSRHHCGSKCLTEYDRAKADALRGCGDQHSPRALTVILQHRYPDTFGTLPSADVLKHALGGGFVAQSVGGQWVLLPDCSTRRRA